MSMRYAYAHERPKPRLTACHLLLQTHSGVVWAYDKARGMVTLQCPSTSGAPDTSNVVMLRSSHIAVRRLQVSPSAMRVCSDWRVCCEQALAVNCSTGLTPSCMAVCAQAVCQHTLCELQPYKPCVAAWCSAIFCIMLITFARQWLEPLQVKVMKYDASRSLQVSCSQNFLHLFHAFPDENASLPQHAFAIKVMR